MYSVSFSAAASSIIARWRPEYSSTIASCTMVSSRCVAGLSTGTRPFSAIATIISAISASASETRSPTWPFSMVSAIVDNCVEPTISATENTSISIAGSASEAIIISRDEPMPPKLVPISIPASASANRALPSRAVMAIRSPDQLNIRLAAKVGISAAATQVAANTKYGAARNSQEAFSATTASLPSSRRRSRYGWISDAPRRRCSRALTLRTSPVSSGDSSQDHGHLHQLRDSSADHARLTAIASGPAAAPPGRQRRTRGSGGSSGTACKLAMVGDPADAAPQRGIQRHPRSDHDVADDARRAVVARRRHVDRLAASGTPPCRTPAAAAGRNWRRNTGWPASGPETRNPRPARAASRGSPGDAPTPLVSSIDTAMKPNTSSPL